MTQHLDSKRKPCKRISLMLISKPPFVSCLLMSHRSTCHMAKARITERGLHKGMDARRDGPLGGHESVIAYELT